MRETKKVMAEFMADLHAGKFKKDIIQDDNGVDLTEKYIEKRIENFEKVLDNPILKEVTGFDDKVLKKKM